MITAEHRQATPVAGHWRGRLAPRRLGIPRIAWLIALLACINAAGWSIVTPPFQVPDEPEHLAYVKQLAETGRLPSKSGSFSLEERLALIYLQLQRVAERPEQETISTQAEQRQLERALIRGARAPGRGSEFAGVAASEPPLYYALQAIPFDLGSGTTLLDRLELMRLFSALFAGLTALFCFLFIREALPSVPWTWTVGALSVALAPLLGFMSGAVTPEAMLYAVSAAVFYALARAFRHGLTRNGALALGALTAVGLMTKLNFVGLAPGVLLGMVLLSVRAARGVGRVAYAWLCLGLAIAVSPALADLALRAASAQTLDLLSGSLSALHGSPQQIFSYVWELYLPRLPGMPSYFAGVFTTRQIWFDRYVGLYGWLDTPFPNWVQNAALIPALSLIGLCARGLIIAGGSRLRARSAELCVYGVIAVGLLTLIGLDSYLVFLNPGFNAEYGQVRYLLPLLPLLGLALALAARSAPRRWAPSVGVAIVVLFLAQDIFSQLQVVARFYG